MTVAVSLSQTKDWSQTVVVTLAQSRHTVCCAAPQVGVVVAVAVAVVHYGRADYPNSIQWSAISQPIARRAQQV